MLLFDAAREPVVTEYHASHAESGWRGDGGELVVCVFGWPTGRPISEPPQPYAMTVPAGVLESLGAPHSVAYDTRAVLA